MALAPPLGAAHVKKGQAAHRAKPPEGGNHLKAGDTLEGALCGWAELGKTCESRQTIARVVTRNFLRGWLKNERQTKNGQDAKS